jgi:hypothetical protein
VEKGLYKNGLVSQGNTFIQDEGYQKKTMKGLLKYILVIHFFLSLDTNNNPAKRCCFHNIRHTNKIFILLIEVVFVMLFYSYVNYLMRQDETILIGSFTSFAMKIDETQQTAPRE